MAAMASSKPIFVVEIASVTEGLDRAAWFTDTLVQIGDYPGVEGIIYFNRSEDPANFQHPPICNPVDYSLDANSGEGKSTCKSIVTQPPYGYLAPSSVEGDHIGMYSRTQKTWYLKDANTDGWANVSTVRFGSIDSSWLPVPGDW